MGAGESALGGGEAAERGGGDGDLPRTTAAAVVAGDAARALDRGNGCGEAARTLVRSGGDEARTAVDAVDVDCGETARGGGDGDLPRCGTARALLLGAEPTRCGRCTTEPASGGDGVELTLGPLLANDCRVSGCATADAAETVGAAGGATVYAPGGADLLSIPSAIDCGCCCCCDGCAGENADCVRLADCAVGDGLTTAAAEAKSS